jgi:hypothetical protein
MGWFDNFDWEKQQNEKYEEYLKIHQQMIEDIMNTPMKTLPYGALDYSHQSYLKNVGIDYQAECNKLVNKVKINEFKIKINYRVEWNKFKKEQLKLALSSRKRKGSILRVVVVDCDLWG